MKCSYDICCNGAIGDYLLCKACTHQYVRGMRESKAGYQKGRAEATAEIVEWLRDRNSHKDSGCDWGDACNAADCIERGEHIAKAKEPSETRCRECGCQVAPIERYESGCGGCRPELNTVKW